MRPPKHIEKYARHYSEPKFFEKMLNFAKRLGIKAVYWAFVLYYALSGDNVSKKERLIILGALGYVILPYDLLPDFLPVIGLTDDIAALTYAVWKVIGNITPEVREKADAKVRDIFGDYDSKDIEISFPHYDSTIDEQ